MRAGTSGGSPYGSPHRSPSVQHANNSPLGSPSDRGMVHTRTNFGKTRGYVPPVVPSTSPGRIGMDAPPSVPPSPRGNAMRMSPFAQDEDDAPDDEAQFRTVRSLRPKPDHTLYRRHNTATQDATSPPRPEAYISETDESSLGQHDLTYEPRPHPPSSPNISRQDARQPSPEEPFDVAPMRSDASKEARHPSPLENNIQTSPIRPSARKQQEPPSPTYSSPSRLTAGEMADLRRRRRRSKNRAQRPPTPEAPEQYTMSSLSPAVEAPPPERVTSTKTSDLTEDTSELDPMPSFDTKNSSAKRTMESEMEYHEEGDLPAPPAESPGGQYTEFVKGTAESPRRDAVMPKSILRESKRGASAASETSDNGEEEDEEEEEQEEDDDSLFDFGGSGDKAVLGKGTSIRKTALKSGGVTNSNTRRGRRARRRSDEESGTEDDESLIQYGEHQRKRSSSLQERTQEAWTFRSKRSFSASASSPKKDAAVAPKKESAGVQFEKKNTVHHFDDQETVGTNATGQSFNSLYTKSPESEAEDLIKDIFLIGSGEHTNPGRRKLKYQPEYKRQLRERADDRSVDDTTLGTTDVSLNTLDHNVGGAGTMREKTTPNTANETTKDEVYASPVAVTRTSDTVSKSACETLHMKSATNEDPLAIVWGFVESGMQALGLAGSPSESNDVDDKAKSASNEEAPAGNAPEEEAVVAKVSTEDGDNEIMVAKSSTVEGVGTSGTASSEDFFVDEVKEDNKGSFGEVMGYIFGGTAKTEEVRLVDAAFSHNICRVVFVSLTSSFRSFSFTAE